MYVKLALKRRTESNNHKSVFWIDTKSNKKPRQCKCDTSAKYIKNIYTARDAIKGEETKLSENKTNEYCHAFRCKNSIEK